MKADTTHLVKMISILLLGILLGVKSMAAESAPPTPTSSAALNASTNPNETSDSKPAAKPKTPAKKAAKAVTECSRKSLQQRDCNISIGDLKVQIWQKKIFTSDGVHRDITDLDFAGEISEWVRGSIKIVNKRTFVEFEDWGPPEPKTEIQSRMWNIFEWANGKLALVLVQPLQKRKAIDKKKFKSDPACKYSFREQNKKVAWSCDREHGVL